MMKISMIVTALICGLVACSKPDLGSPKGKASYAIGHDIGRRMKSQGIEVDTTALAAGMSDTFAGSALKMSDTEMQLALQDMGALRATSKNPAAASATSAKGKEYLDANKAKPGVIVTASGLQYKVITPGSGPSPTAASKVKVHYRGTLIDGTEFDSSYQRGQPAEFGVGQVIRGWTEALQLMKKGAKYQLTIPSELAYGDRESPKIPANSVLNFEVELLDIK